MTRHSVCTGRTCSTSSIQREVIQAQGHTGSNQNCTISRSAGCAVMIAATLRRGPPFPAGKGGRKMAGQCAGRCRRTGERRSRPPRYFMHNDGRASRVPHAQHQRAGHERRRAPASGGSFWAGRVLRSLRPSVIVLVFGDAAFASGCMPPPVSARCRRPTPGALDGNDALEHLAVTRYDVVVLDRDLPGVHGDEVCRQIVAGGSQSRVLLLTAASTVRERVDGLGLGGRDYLAKPVAFSGPLAPVPRPAPPP